MADVLDEDFLQHFTVVGTSGQQHVNGRVRVAAGGQV
jgi:hypothetical protein